jgi:MFS family permease
MPPSPPRRAWLVVALLLLFMLINFADKAAFGLAAVPIMAEFGLSHSAFGLLGASFFLLFAISGVAIGFAANHVKCKWLLAGMAALWSCAQLLPVVLPTLPAFFASRVLLGAGEGPAAPVAQHALYKWFEDRSRTLPTGIVTVGVPLGAGLAAPILTYVIARWSWQTAFGLLSAVGLIWGAFWLAVGREGEVDENPAGTAALEVHILYRRLLLNATVVGAVIAGFGAYWCLTLSLIWLPPYLIKGMGYAPSTAGWIVTLPFLATAIVMPGSGYLSQALSERGVSSWLSRGALAGGCTVASGMAMVAMALLPPGALHTLMLTAAFSLGSAVLVVGPPLAAEISPSRQRGAVLGTVTAVATSAGLIAPVVTGRIVDAATNPQHGYTNGFLTAGAVAVIAGALALILIRPERDRSIRINRTTAPMR